MIFVGHGGIGSNAFSLYKGFSKHLEYTFLLDTKFFDDPPKFSLRRITNKFLPKFYGLIASIVLHIKIRILILKTKSNCIFVFKGNFISAYTLNRFNGIKIHYHPDDSSSQSGRTNIFNKSEIVYDLHFTSKRHNIAEIKNRTHKRVNFIWYAYDEEWHFPIQEFDFINPEFRVGFLGHFYPNRSDFIAQISMKYGKTFAISGLKWNREQKIFRVASCFPPSFGIDFSRFVSRAPVQIGLLNSANRDQHTARSFEIPATGALIIAEDTSEHREIFISEENALFFSNINELFEKIDWVVSHPKEAADIAKSGYNLITKKGNRWSDRALEILRIIENLS